MNNSADRRFRAAHTLFTQTQHSRGAEHRKGGPKAALSETSLLENYDLTLQVCELVAVFAGEPS
jgi:hypothetical protein